ncbi:hypothetical protein [Geobacter sp.]|uniref:hypothetical protein n=1 Tax=Geobacter sp. TaxID=46610 RepID=UPI0026283147|nr:hypothetical protein [Geobacter sp.]
MSAQQGLFDTGLSEGALDISLGFRQGLARAITACGMNRYHIAAEISRLTQSNLSKDMLDKYTSSDLSYGIRAEIIPAFCHVTRQMDTVRQMVDPLGADVVNPEDRDLLELARLLEEQKKIDARIMAIRAKRGIK